MTRSVLMLSYLFPPRAGAGVQRALKLAKHLPRFGWRPLVVANGAAAEDRVTPIQDPTLLADLPEEALVRYTTLTFHERAQYLRAQSPWQRRLAPTDSMAWWIEPAERHAMDLVARHRPSAILVTMSPFTAAEAGLRLRRRTGLPLVLDLRDPWALDETRIYPTRWHARRDWAAMQRATAEADLVIVNTPQAAAAVRRSFRVSPAARVIPLTNGFDADDFASTHGRAVPPARSTVLRIVHAGALHSEQAEVWDALFARRGLVGRMKYARRPINLWTRTARYLLEAMRLLAAESRACAELVLVGELSAADRALIDASPVRATVRMTGYQTHAQSVAWLQSADVLFLPLHTPLDGGPALVVPGKTYEYLGSGRPILAMGPPGDLRDFVRGTRSGFAIAGDDARGAARILLALHKAKLAGQRMIVSDGAATARFERREQARTLARELDRLAGSRQPRHSPITTQHFSTRP